MQHFNPITRNLFVHFQLVIYCIQEWDGYFSFECTIFWIHTHITNTLIQLSLKFLGFDLASITLQIEKKISNVKVALHIFYVFLSFDFFFFFSLLIHFVKLLNICFFLFLFAITRNIYHINHKRSALHW